MLHKVQAQRRSHLAGKRSIRQERDIDGAGLLELMAHDPSPDEAVALADELEQALVRLEPLARRIFELRPPGPRFLEEIAIPPRAAASAMPSAAPSMRRRATEAMVRGRLRKLGRSENNRAWMFVSRNRQANSFTLGGFAWRAPEESLILFRTVTSPPHTLEGYCAVPNFRPLGNQNDEPGPSGRLSALHRPRAGRGDTFPIRSGLPGRVGVAAH